jgi:uncharacterized protein (TIGR02231 family)
MLKSQVAGAAPRRRSEVEADEELVITSQNAMETPVMEISTYGTMSNTAVARLYSIDHPFTLTANNKPATVKLQAYDLPVSLRYKIVPKREQRAYVEAIITGWDTLSLLPAQTRTHLDGRYLGKTFINPEVLNDTLSVGLGADDRVIVKRTGRGQGSDTKVIRGVKEYKLGYNIALRNTRDVAVQVVIVDQIPVSQRDEVKIELKEATGKPKMEDFSGQLTWELSLKPTEERELSVRYEITAPRDMPVRFE